MAKTKVLNESEFVPVTPSELETFLKQHCLDGEAALIEGPPGCGKTEITKQIADQCGKPMLSPFNCVLSDGVDQKGIPAINKERTSVNWVKDQRWMFAAENATTVLLDEIGQGNNSSINACGSIIHEKRIDDVFLHPDTWVVGTANRAQDKCGSQRIPNQIYDRAWCYELMYDLTDHVARELTFDDVDHVTIRFLRMKGDTVFSFDPSRKVQSTPRGWSVVARKLHARPDTPLATIAGRIGHPLATELFSFRPLVNEIPTPEQVLMDPKKARVPTNTSAQFLITDMLADIATFNSFDALVQYVKRMPEEMQAKMVKDSMTRHPEVAGTEAFTKWGVKFAAVLR